MQSLRKTTQRKKVTKIHLRELCFKLHVKDNRGITGHVSEINVPLVAQC